MKTFEEIQTFLDKFDAQQNRYKGMTYEQGVEESLMWVLQELYDSDFAPKYDLDMNKDK